MNQSVNQSVNQSANKSALNTARSLLFLVMLASLSACELQQRRVEVAEPSGADQSLDERFGLSDDAQDPTKRDQELGYGRWKAKPETAGTTDPTSPSRRGSGWSGKP